jgi:hypothetical protein
MNNHLLYIVRITFKFNERSKFITEITLESDHWKLGIHFEVVTLSSSDYLRVIYLRKVNLTRICCGSMYMNSRIISSID